MDEKARESNRLRQRKFLELHKDEVNNKRREKYHERISHGKCPRCGGRTKKGHTLCTNCCEYMLDLNRKYAKRDKAAVKAKVKTTAKAKAKAKAPAKKAR
jgi:predicted nucleic acid-binding Zn ribbon protein